MNASQIKLRFDISSFFLCCFVRPCLLKLGASRLVISLADTSVKPCLKTPRRVNKIYKQQVCALIITPLAFVASSATRVTNVLVNIQGGKYEEPCCQRVAGKYCFILLNEEFGYRGVVQDVECSTPIRRFYFGIISLYSMDSTIKIMKEI